jgi:hypothetical protein
MDAGCQTIAGARSANSCIFKIRANANTKSHALQYRYCCSVTGNILFHLGLNSTSNPERFHQTRIQHISRISRYASRTRTNRMLSACFYIPTPFRHMLTFHQYQVFQDLQGPASSLRVGSSVRTSTRPLSVSLLRLCLRYLTCIQRR